MWTTSADRGFLNFGNQDVIVNLAYVTSVTASESHIYFNLSSGKYVDVDRYENGKDIWPVTRDAVLGKDQTVPF